MKTPPGVLTEIGRKAAYLNKAIPCKLFPQLDLPDEYIFSLSRLHENGYILYPIVQSLAGTLDPSSTLPKSYPKIPTGLVNFVIRADEPMSVLCFERAAIIANDELVNRVAGPVNYGHSSLCFNSTFLCRTPGVRGSLYTSKLKGLALAAISAYPVLLAGTILFPQHDNPCASGGDMECWSNDSGHYKPSIKDAEFNRPGFIKHLLPMEKFLPRDEFEKRANRC